ncbi:MAG TPA: hypothetical protein VFU44_07330, partial [Candidatus Limnocylindria bacterium]|nr:hypothetical protein [Candidatus Limnocylindria bacterium]
IFFAGAGIPIVMGVLGLLTLWAGIASWRRNSRAGLHEHDRGMAPAEVIDMATAPGVPEATEPATREAPHRHRRRRRKTTDGD